MDFKDITKTLKPNPSQRANPFSKIFFLWTIPLFRRGVRKGLSFQDLWNHRDKDHARSLGDKLELAWNSEKEKRKKPSLVRALLHVFGGRMALCWFLYLIHVCVFTVSQPVFLSLLVTSYENDEQRGDGRSLETYLYTLGVCLSVFFNIMLLHPTVFEVFHLGMRSRVAVSSLLYRKALTLSREDATVGRLINLLSNDVNRLDTSLNYLPYLLAGPIQCVIFTYLLWQSIGLPSCFVPIGVVTLLFPLQYMNGKYSAKIRQNVAKWTDERGRVMSEIIMGMRVIKYYAWEKPFSKLIAGLRGSEVQELKKRAILRGLNLAFIHASPKLIAFGTFLLYVLLGNEMTVEQVFLTLTVVNLMCQQMTHYFPVAATGLGELLVAIGRMEEFLLLKEQKGLGSFITKGDSDSYSEPEIKLENFTGSWSVGERATPTLDGVTAHITGSKLVMVVGPVGAGKTSFLHALIGELSPSSGTVALVGEGISYASQEPWVFQGNLRQNILCGQEYDASRYQETVKCCSLQRDFAQLPYADMTMVGESGNALSGGQRARVSLARAVYRKADIYLMDDPLSAVDTKVSRDIFDKCVKGKFLQGSLRVLATHQLQYLPQADHIIVLNQGKIIAQGTYEELINQEGIDFINLMTIPPEIGAANKRASLLRRFSELYDTEETIDTVVKTSDDDGPKDQHQEKMNSGSVTGKTYAEYITHGKSNLEFIILSVIFFLGQVFVTGNDYWLSYWTRADSFECSPTDNESCQEDWQYLYVYAGINCGVILFNMARAVWFFYFCCKISINLHNAMFVSMVKAPIKFFDDNPSGRIMNIFTKDMGAVDEMLPPALADTLATFLQMIGVVVVVIMSNYYMAIPTVVLFLGLYGIRKFFVQTSRDLKRMEALSRSPLFTHVAATMHGITTIRVSGIEPKLLEQFDGHQSIHSSVWFLYLATTRWFGMWVEIMSCVFLAVVALSFLLISSSAASGNIALSISSCLTLMGSFQLGMRQSAEAENYMTSVERALDYTKIEPETTEEEALQKSTPPKEWPSSGEVMFNNVFLSYDEKPVLKNLSFEVPSGSKIGIVGRTGDGKSSLIAALFKMSRQMEGKIFIDGVDTDSVPLQDLRRHISIIPQDPVLFSGTVRINLDPFNEFEDNELWNALGEVELKGSVIPTLEFEVADAGSNFSVGQKQLVCLARAILRKNKLIVMDEATANVDPKTDDLIQRTIRSKFADCTILTVAHRLHTVIDCDKILVLDHGSLAEYDHPHKLLQIPSGIFSSMVEQTGRTNAALLRKSAEDGYKSKSAAMKKED